MVVVSNQFNDAGCLIGYVLLKIGCGRVLEKKEERRNSGRVYFTGVLVISGLNLSLYTAFQIDWSDPV